jgi:hypothetical protein
VSNEALEENTEETDVMSILAEQGSKVDDEVVDDDTTMPETVEELQAALTKEREIKTKRNKSLKKSKQAQHRTQEENDKLLERLTKVEERQNNGQSTVEAERLEKLSQDWKEKVEDDPTAALEYVNAKQSELEGKLSNYLEGKFSAIAEMFDELKSSTNPERIEYSKEIEALRGREEFEDLDDSTLATVAKVLRSAKIKASRGTINGKRAGKPVPKKFAVSSDEINKMGFAKLGD